MTNKIAVFGGNIQGKKIIELKEEANNLGIILDLFSYSEIVFETKDGKILVEGRDLNNYDVYFFRKTKKYWEEVSLILDQLDEDKIIIDPIVKNARPSDSCKAYQMLRLSQAKLPVPRSIYGGLDFLKNKAIKEFEFPVIIKGSRGDRRKQVFKLYGEEDFEARIEELKLIEENGENKYMLQEYIVNEEDYRVMVLGNKVLGTMKRAIGDNPKIKDQYSQVSLPEKIEKLTIEAAKICGVAIAGVDIVFRNKDFDKPLFYEVNRSPSYDRFMESTGINVPKEIVKYLANLKLDQ